jgi:O-acetyl-ADP-ribose deacetylase (regulator of RNase III)
MPLHIIREDITNLKVDAIVNTTNEEMVGYSGVDYAVHKKAGRLLDEECARIAPLGLGTAKITKGYDLDAKYVIHTSGPVWSGGLLGESIILKSCYIESLKLAVAQGCKSVAFPLISAGTYGYPKDQVLKFAIQVITEFLYENELTVYLCVFDRNSYEFSKTLYAQIKRVIEDTDKEECSATLFKTVRAQGKIIRSNSKAQISKSCAAPSEEFDAKNQCSSVKGKSLDEYMRDMDKPFAFKLFEWIDIKGMTDVECYKKANVDKKTFSKIKCNPDKYKPSKPTAVAFAIALKLSFEETQDLLASAGLTLSRSFTFDKIIRYFIQNEVYDIFEINEALFEFDQVLLGC